MDDDPEAVIKNWLAVLMPLHIPAPSASIANPLDEMAKQLQGLDPAVCGLVEFAPRGPHAVRSRLHQIVAEPLEDNTSE